LNTVKFDKSQWIYEEVIIKAISAQDEVLDPVEVYDSNIHSAQLNGSTLRRWVFENCNFKECDLSNITFNQCVFQNCTFNGCRLIGSDWSQSTRIALHVQFENCDLSLSNFTQVQCSAIRFKDCRCMDVDFSGSTLAKSVFINTSVKGSLFEDSDLRDADLVGALDNNFHPDDSQLNGASISIHTAIRLIESQGMKVKMT
jgi:fluoroquinolone resistance protein